MPCFRVRSQFTTLAEVHAAAGLSPPTHGGDEVVPPTEWIMCVRDPKAAREFAASRCCREGCGAEAEHLCDYPMGRGRTCDAPLCVDHRAAIGRNLDLCPVHLAQYRGAPVGLPRRAK